MLCFKVLSNQNNKMVFKLVRIDTQKPCKIPLTIGKHVIGRGKFLHNDETDKRVSRYHAELVVTPDTVSLKSLHQNPCFFAKESIETHLLHQDTTVCLSHGDKFGLLPDHFWYEVIHCPDQDNAEERATIPETAENGVHNDEEDIIVQPEEVREQDNVTPGISVGAEKVEKAINFDDGEEEVDPIRSGSPSLLTTEEDAAKQMTAEPETAEQVTTTQEPVDQVPEKNHTRAEAQVTTEQEPAKEPVTIKQEPANQDTKPYDSPAQVPRTDDPRSPAKRDHSSSESSPVDVKKVKIEQGDAGVAAAGPSNGQQASADIDGKDNLATPASPPQPAPSPRERCHYGANCYRRNPQHKAQFSHPSDSDWGAGERGECPYGAACRRRAARHWLTHAHPPGTQPPGDFGPRPGQRRKRRPRNESVSDDDDVEDSSVRNLIVTGKRARKTLSRQDWSGADSDEEIDPYGTDESDEWQPPSDFTTSQDFSQDL